MSQTLVNNSESGLTSTSASNLYDELGNPRVLSKGWLSILDPDNPDIKKAKSRFFIVAPTYFAYFASESAAAINSDGFLIGEAFPSTPTIMGSNGVSFFFNNIFEISFEDREEPVILVVLREPVGSINTLTLAGKSLDELNGWLDMLQNQLIVSKSIEAPVRVKVEQELTAKDALKAVKSFSNGLLGSFKLSKKPEIVRDDTEYVHSQPWLDKGIDLMSKAFRSCLEDEFGHPAVVMCGWLTKKNKSGIRAGQVEKDRYFVLTPVCLAFFVDEAMADIRKGYLYGKTDGDKIGMFARSGARLPLESVCDVLMISTFEESNESKRLDGRNGTSTVERSRGDNGVVYVNKASTLNNRASLLNYNTKDSKGSVSSPRSNEVVPNRVSYGTDSESDDEKEKEPERYEVSDGVVPLVEIDLGDVSLIINAHNTKNRIAWVNAIRHWSKWRKQSVDEDMFHSSKGL